jgi:hypothetical protein
VRDQDSHPYRTTVELWFLYILTFTFLDSRRDDKNILNINLLVRKLIATQKIKAHYYACARLKISVSV